MNRFVFSLITKRRYSAKAPKTVAPYIISESEEEELSIDTRKKPLAKPLGRPVFYKAKKCYTEKKNTKETKT